MLEAFVTQNGKKNPLEIFLLKEKIMGHLNIPIFHSRSEIVVKTLVQDQNFLQNFEVF